MDRTITKTQTIKTLLRLPTRRNQLKWWGEMVS